jgi:hypothetical protein
MPAWPTLAVVHSIRLNTDGIANLKLLTVTLVVPLFGVLNGE